MDLLSRTVSSKMNVVMQIRGLCVEEEDVERQIVELNMMEKILDTSAWTAEDLDLVGDARHSRLNRCALELDRHRLLGGDGFTGNLRMVWMIVRSGIECQMLNRK